MSRLALTAAAGATGAVEEVDEFFENTVLLLHGDGTSGAQNNTFLDSSTNNFTVTRNGNTTQGTFTPFSKVDGRFGNFFDGTDDFVNIGTNYPAALDLGSSNFTIEGFVYLQAATKQLLLGNLNDSNGTGTFFVMLNNTTASTRYEVKLGGTAYNLGSGTLPTNQWVHVCLMRSGTDVYLFEDGVQVGATQTFSGSIASVANQLRVGGASTGQYDLNGYVSNVRMVIGSVVYGTSGFTTPTSPLTAIANTSLLTCQSNRFKDNSYNAIAIAPVGNTRITPFSPFPLTTAYDTAVNGGSGFFDGSGDFLTYTTPDSVVREWWNTDWTIEAWIYPNTLTGLSYTETSQKISTMVGNASATATNNFWSFGPVDNGLVKFYYFNGVPIHTAITTAAIVVGQWNHVAMIYNSSGIKLFVNGVGTSYIAVSGTPQSGSTLPLIVGQINNTAINGYVSGLRIVRGSNVYTTDFTPPTSPPTAITNTSLLLNYTNAGIFDNTAFNNLETVADAQIDTSVVKYGTGAIEFDGTGDFLLVIGDANNFVFGTGNFTIEMWINPSTIVPQFQGVWDSRTADPSVTPHITLNDGKVTWWVSGASRIQDASALSTATWHHIAVARSGTSTKMFVNGTQVGNTYTDSNNYLSRAVPIIGINFDALFAFTGYIDDLRITKGIARYTAAFTPPTEAFPNIGD